MESEIFVPMYYLMLLTVIVLLLSITVRLKEIYVNKTVVGETHRHPPFDEGSRLLKNLQMNLKDSNSPVLIEDKSDKDSFYVIMPMKI